MYYRYGISFLLTVLSVLVLTACGTSEPPPPPPLTSTVNCPPVTPIPHPFISEYGSSHALYILIDNSHSYKDEKEQAISLLSSILEQSLQPGDEIAIGLIGVGAADISVQAQTISLIPTPDIDELTHSSLLTLQPTLTPLTNNNITTVQRQHSRHSTAVVQANATTEAILEVSFNCEIQEWNANYLDKLESYKTQQTQEHVSALDDIAAALSELSSVSSENETDIFSALYTASEFFAEARRQGYEQLTLLIFSDMAHTASSTEGLEGIDFSQVVVTIALVPYDVDQFDNSDDVRTYEQRKTYWEEWFMAKQAQNSTFLSVPVVSETSLLSIIVRE